MPKAAVDLIKAICHKNPEERLTMKSHGVQNLHSHKWFGEFDWTKLTAGEMEAPWKPQFDQEAVVAKIAAKPPVPEPVCEDYHDDRPEWEACFVNDEDEDGEDD